MGSARRWKRKQSANRAEYERSSVPSEQLEEGDINAILDFDVDGPALGWACKKCGAGGSTLFSDRTACSKASSSLLTAFASDHRRCQRQASTQLPVGVAEAFDSLREVFDAALGVGDQCGPTAIIIGTNTGLVCQPFSNDDEKRFSLSLFRAGCRALLAKTPTSIGVAVGIEAWRSSDVSVRPSLDLGRTEGVHLFALTDFGSFGREYLIERKGGEPGEGPGRLVEPVSPLVGTLFAPAFHTCAARPFFQVSEGQLMS
jgi:hypothetical protein